MTPSEKLVPNLFLRATLNNLEDYLDQVEQEDDPDTRLYCNKHGRFPSSVNDKDSLILKKNRGLDKADINVVQNGTDVSQLPKVSVISLEVLRWAEEIIREVNEKSSSALYPTYVFRGRFSETERKGRGLQYNRST